MDRDDSQDPLDRRSDRRPKGRLDPWTVVVGLVVFFLWTVWFDQTVRDDAPPPAPTSVTCAQCVTKWLGQRDPCDEFRERLPDHDRRTSTTSRSWDDRGNTRYEPDTMHGYVECEVTPSSTASEADVLRAGTFVLDEAQEKVAAQVRAAAPHVTQQRAATSLWWQVPGYTTSNSDQIDGTLSLQLREGWRGRWLRIEVEERARPWRE